MIGKRLKLARTAAGLSLRGLQERIGNRVSAQQIGKYERDEDVPNSGILIALSDALGVSLDYLAGDQNMALEAVEFRKKQITSKKEQAQIQAKALHMIERYLIVEEILALPSAEWDKPREAPYPVCELAEADRAAQNLREQWKLGIDPIPNLIELLEERGIKVLVVESEENIDGLAAQVRRGEKEPIKFIVIRTGVHGERQRFNLAHELGHIIMDVQGDERFREKAAYRFAGAFLMPAEALWSNVGRHRSSIGWSELFALKKLFGASVQAITYRCGDLRIFPPSLSQRLFQEFSRLGFRSAPNYEPKHLVEEIPGRFNRLCYRAFAEGAISEPKTAELLNITVRELNHRMEEPAVSSLNDSDL
jgi:Zn-dependent peptidase ImmA (M78 family)